MPAQPINDHVGGGVKKVLDALNSSGGTPIERPFSRSARRALIDAQNSVTVDLSRVDHSDQFSDADLAGNRCGFRYRVIQRVLGRLFPHSKHDDLVLGQLPEGPRAAPRKVSKTAEAILGKLDRLPVSSVCV